jgi:succinoglycan biosynthesis transport protein ExoP
MDEKNTGLIVRRDTSRPPSQVIQGAAAEYAGYPAERQSNAFDSILSMLQRRMWLVLGVFLAVSSLGVIVTLLQTPKYQATALLVINPNPDQIVPEKQFSGTRAEAAAVDSEIEALKSPTLAARLASELELDRDPEWNAALKDGGPAAADAKAVQTASVVPENSPFATGGFADTATTNAFNIQIKAPSAGDGLPADAARLPRPESVGRVVRPVADDVALAVAGAMDVRRRGMSYVVEVTAESESPERAAEMANGLSNIYLKTLSEARYDASEKANGWLRDRLDELKDEVQQKQAAATQYRAQRNLLTAQGVSLVEQQLAQIQSSLLVTRAEYAQKRAEYDLLADMSRKGGSIASINSSDDAMRDFRAKEAEVAQRIADLASRYGPNHPALHQAKEEKAALDSRIKDEMQRSAAKSKIESDSLGARMNKQEAELASLRGDLVSGNFDQVRLDALQTDAQTAQSVYESFLQRYHEIARQGTMTGVGARLLSPARPPAIAASPHLLLNGALSVAAGLILAFLAGLLVERFRGTVETTEEVEQRVGARALVAIPSLKTRDLNHMPARNRTPTAYLLTKRMSQFAEAFRVLQASILLANQPANKVVAITSAMPGEGKTTLSVGLARVAAMGGQKAIVVDCDIRMRSVNTVLGIDPSEGLQQVLSGERHWRDVVGCDEQSGAHVLPASGLTTKDLFSGGAMEQLIEDLRKQYDLVVLDCAPIFAVADTRVIASIADAVVVAARARKTPARALAAAIAQLEIAGARVLGVALNRVDTRSGRRSFYDGLYYSKAFSGYYAREN